MRISGAGCSFTFLRNRRWSIAKEIILLLKQTTITINDNANRKAGVWGEAPSKVAGATAPDNQPLPRGKGFGVRDNKFTLS